jgi:hypothetical protein
MFIWKRQEPLKVPAFSSFDPLAAYPEAEKRIQEMQ